MVKINTERTKEFAQRCNLASPELIELFLDLRRLHEEMLLFVAPAHSIDFSAANRESDDLGDVGYIADTLVLDAIGADSADVPERYQDKDAPPWDKVGAAINTAGNLENGGDDGRRVRDRRNASTTVLALEAALRAGADIQVTDTGLIVAVRTKGMPIDLGKVGEKEVPLNAKGGTTYGNVFITTPDAEVKLNEFDQPSPESKTAALLGHEEVHAYQWAAAGAVKYPVLYGLESRHDAKVKVKTKKVRIKGRVGGGGNTPINIDVEVKFPTLGVDTSHAGCKNRFEQDAGLEEGNYDCEP